MFSAWYYYSQKAYFQFQPQNAEALQLDISAPPDASSGASRSSWIDDTQLLQHSAQQLGKVKDGNPPCKIKYDLAVFDCLILVSAGLTIALMMSHLNIQHINIIAPVVCAVAMAIEIGCAWKRVHLHLDNLYSKAFVAIEKTYQQNCEINNRLNNFIDPSHRLAIPNKKKIEMIEVTDQAVQTYMQAHLLSEIKTITISTKSKLLNAIPKNKAEVKKINKALQQETVVVMDSILQPCREKLATMHTHRCTPQQIFDVYEKTLQSQVCNTLQDLENNVRSLFIACGWDEPIIDIQLPSVVNNILSQVQKIYTKTLERHLCSLQGKVIWTDSLSDLVYNQLQAFVLEQCLGDVLRSININKSTLVNTLSQYNPGQQEARSMSTAISWIVKIAINEDLELAFWIKSLHGEDIAWEIVWIIESCEEQEKFCIQVLNHMKKTLTQTSITDIKHQKLQAQCQNLMGRSQMSWAASGLADRYIQVMMEHHEEYDQYQQLSEMQQKSIKEVLIFMTLEEYGLYTLNIEEDRDPNTRCSICAKDHLDLRGIPTEIKIDIDIFFKGYLNAVKASESLKVNFGFHKPVSIDYSTILLIRNNPRHFLTLDSRQQQDFIDFLSRLIHNGYFENLLKTGKLDQALQFCSLVSVLFQQDWIITQGKGKWKQLGAWLSRDIPDKFAHSLDYLEQNSQFQLLSPSERVQFIQDFMSQVFQVTVYQPLAVIHPKKGGDAARLQKWMLESWHPVLFEKQNSLYALEVAHLFNTGCRQDESMDQHLFEECLEFTLCQLRLDSQISWPALEASFMALYTSNHFQHLRDVEQDGVAPKFCMRYPLEKKLQFLQKVLKDLDTHVLPNPHAAKLALCKLYLTEELVTNLQSDACTGYFVQRCMMRGYSLYIEYANFLIALHRHLGHLALLEEIKPDPKEEKIKNISQIEINQDEEKDLPLDDDLPKVHQKSDAQVEIEMTRETQQTSWIGIIRDGILGPLYGVIAPESSVKCSLLHLVVDDPRMNDERIVDWFKKMINLCLTNKENFEDHFLEKNLIVKITGKDVDTGQEVDRGTCLVNAQNQLLKEHLVSQGRTNLWNHIELELLKLDKASGVPA